MSLTSYRAAPPRVECVSGPRLSPGCCSTGRSPVLAGSHSSYEPDELSGCSTPRWVWVWGGRPGGDLLFRALRRSTIGAEGFHGRVRDGIGCFAPRYGHQAFSGIGVGDRISQPPWFAAAAPPIVRTLLISQKRVVCVSF